MVRRAGNWWHPFFFSSRRRHTRWPRDWSSDVCSSDLVPGEPGVFARVPAVEKSRAVMPLLELEQARVEYDQHGKGAPQLLLLHSLLTELSVFDGVLSKLARSRRVTRINLPGFGRSSPVRLDSVGAHADHVARVMGALELPRDTDVFGNGFGAFVALELAIRHGTRFRRLVVADTLAVFPEAARTPCSAMAQRVSEAARQAALDTAIGRMIAPAAGR